MVNWDKWSAVGKQGRFNQLDYFSLFKLKDWIGLEWLKNYATQHSVTVQ